MPLDAEADVADVLRQWILGGGFSCLGARVAVKHGSLRVVSLGRCGDPRTTRALHSSLERFVHTDISVTEDFATLVAVFNGPCPDSEEEFEHLFWSQLQALHDFDRCTYEWAPDVDPDPTAATFGFSIAGHPFFLVGLHPAASRISRRFRLPSIAFNSHRQFRRLKEKGLYTGLQRRIREREFRLQRSINPSLAEHGTVSEARQYSGRLVEEDWRCPFVPGDTDADTSTAQPDRAGLRAFARPDRPAQVGASQPPARKWPAPRVAPDATARRGRAVQP